MRWALILLAFAATAPAETTSVLLLEQRARWEYRHLCKTLARLPEVRFQAFLSDASDDFLPPASPGLEPLRALPEPLSDYDMIIMGDAALTVDDGLRLVEAVAAGTGLLWIAGEADTAEVPSPLLSALLPPMVVQRVLPGATLDPRELRLTEAGEALLPASVRSGLGSYGPRWYAPVSPADSALVFLEHDGGLPPLLWGWQYGKGRVLFQASDEMWRLRRAGVEVYDTYYGRLLAWASGRIGPAPPPARDEPLPPEPVGDPRENLRLVWSTASLDQGDGVPVELTQNFSTALSLPGGWLLTSRRSAFPHLYDARAMARIDAVMREGDTPSIRVEHTVLVAVEGGVWTPEAGPDAVGPLSLQRFPWHAQLSAREYGSAFEAPPDACTLLSTTADRVAFFGWVRLVIGRRSRLSMAFRDIRLLQLATSGEVRETVCELRELAGLDESWAGAIVVGDDGLPLGLAVVRDGELALAESQWTETGQLASPVTRFPAVHARYGRGVLAAARTGRRHLVVFRLPGRAMDLDRALCQDAAVEALAEVELTMVFLDDGELGAMHADTFAYWSGEEEVLPLVLLLDAEERELRRAPDLTLPALLDWLDD